MNIDWSCRFQERRHLSSSTTIFGFAVTDRIDLTKYGYKTEAVAILGKNNVLSITGLTSGTVTLNLDPGATYTGQNFNLASDGHGGTVVTIQNTPAPHANNDSYSLPENTRLSVDMRHGVLVNDVNPTSYVLSAVLVGNTQHGKVSLNHDGSFDYTPVKVFIGDDSFTYRAVEGNVPLNIATVSLHVRAAVASKSAAGDPLGLLATFTASGGVATSSRASGSLPEAGSGSGHTAMLLTDIGKAEPTSGIFTPLHCVGLASTDFFRGVRRRQ